AVLSVTPAGAPIFFSIYRGLRALTRSYPRLVFLRPCRGLFSARLRSQTARQIPICRAGMGFSQNVADISIACKIFGTRVCILQAESRIFIDFSCAQAHIMEYEQT
ncbi:MAG: hypothetical protein IJN23_01020, partial [Akkermansia sp.]|nr:hypothetical protein [Akkermansia sp.]